LYEVPGAGGSDGISDRPEQQVVLQLLDLLLIALHLLQQLLTLLLQFMLLLQYQLAQQLILQTCSSQPFSWRASGMLNMIII
jgi:hypothetical protein